MFLMKTTLDRIKKKSRANNENKRKTFHVHVKFIWFLVLIRALFQRLMMTKCLESVRPKANSPEFPLNSKKNSLEFKKYKKIPIWSNLIKSDQTWSNLIKSPDLIRFGFFDIVWIQVNSFLISKVFFGNLLGFQQFSALMKIVFAES